MSQLPQSLTDDSFSTMSNEQIEADLCRRLESVRLMKNINQTDLARQAGVSRRTISRMENGQGVSLDTFIRVMRALELTEQLEQLIPATTIRPIERVQLRQPRKHASSPRKSDKLKPWKWGS